MGNETNAHGLISAVTHNGSSVSVVKNIHAASALKKMIVPGQGKIGPSVKAVVGFDRMVHLMFVGQARIAINTKGTLVAPVIRADDVTIDTHQWTSMKAFEDTYDIEDGSGNHDVVGQVLEYEGDGSADNYTYTPGS